MPNGIAVSNTDNPCPERAAVVASGRVPGEAEGDLLPFLAKESGPMLLSGPEQVSGRDHKQQECGSEDYIRDVAAPQDAHRHQGQRCHGRNQDSSGYMRKAFRREHTCTKRYGEPQERNFPGEHGSAALDP